MDLRGSPNAKHLVARPNKVLRARWHRNRTAQNHFVRNILAIVRIGVRTVLVDDISIEIDARKKTPAAGVRQKFSVRKLSRGRLGIASDWTRCNRCIRAELDLVPQ